MLAPSLFFLPLLAVVTTTADASANVVTANGVITGTELTVDGRSVWQFLGIPFAKPPVGNLRFRPPEPLERKWSEPLIADKAPKGCLQPPFLFTYPEHLMPSYGEDCLYLDVWTPSPTSTAKKTVMVWIHGGGFIYGEGLPLYNGKALSAIGDVVVVTIQYRLGLLGFARLDSALVPGNNGLLDQQMAFRWVHENIAQFGGDPESVTIFGESAGSASVSFHLLNEESGKYYKRGIMQSGTIANVWGANPNTGALEKMNRDLASKHLNCNQQDASELLQCLQSKSESEILDAIQKFGAENPSGPFPGPTIDGHFISRTPLEILASGDILKKDVIIGITEQEGSFFVVMGLRGYAAAINYTDPDITKLADEAFVNSTVESMFKYYPTYPNEMSPLAKEMIQLRSLSHVNPKRGDLNAIKLSEELGQALFYCGDNKYVDAIRAVHDNVYFYEMAHKPIHSILWSIFKAATPSWVKCTHGDDIPFVFALPVVHPELSKMTEDEMHLARRMIADFTTFAKTGSPRDPNWRPFTLEKKEFYRYGLTSTLQSGGIQRDGCVFWSKVLPMVNSIECRQDAESKCTLSMGTASKDRRRSDEL